MPTPKPRPSTDRSAPSRPASPRPTTSRSSGPASRPASRPASSRPSSSRPTSSRSSSAPRTVDLSASSKGRPKSAARAPQGSGFNSDDPGVKRRAVKKQQAKRKNLTVWSVFVVASVILTSMSLGVWNGKGRYVDSKKRLSSKQATLHDLKVELEKAKRRIAAMSSDAGKHQTLVENGYLRKNERLLFFPDDKPKKTP